MIFLKPSLKLFSSTLLSCSIYPSTKQNKTYCVPSYLSLSLSLILVFTNGVVITIAFSILRLPPHSLCCHGLLPDTCTGPMTPSMPQPGKTL